MEETVQEVHLELTKKDKNFVKNLIKIRLGVNWVMEEDDEASFSDENSSVITNDNYSELQIEIMKKTLIEQVFCQYLEKNIISDPAKNLPCEEQDVNSSSKGANGSEITPENIIKLNQNKIVSENTEKKRSEMSQEFPFTRKEDYFVTNEIEGLPVNEINDSKADVSNCFYSNSQSTSSIALNVESDDVLLIDENYDDMFEEKESCEPQNVKLKEDKKLSSTSHYSDKSYKLIPQYPGIGTSNDGHDSPTILPAHARIVIEPFKKSEIFSHLQRKLAENKLNSTGCLYQLCDKCKWPRPKFYKITSSSYHIFGVSVGKLKFQGHQRTQNIRSAKNLASAACLEYFGFECPDKKLICSTYSVTKKGGSLVTMIGKDLKQQNNNCEASPLQLEGNAREQCMPMDKITAEKMYSNSGKHPDLRLKLNMKRGIKESLQSGTENSCSFSNPSELV